MMNQSVKMVQEWFMAERFAPGDRLPPERILAGRLGLSRAALRHGLGELEAAGLLLRQIGRGTFVRAGAGEAEPAPLAMPPGFPDCSPRHLLSARLAVEPPLARLAAREATRGDLDRVREAAAAAGASPDWDRFEEADHAFHRAIAAACRNPALLDLFDRLTAGRRAFDWGRLRERGRPPQGLEDHAGIVAALAARDAHAAEDSTRHHLMVEAATIFGLLV